jgi:hypothetical protein
MFKFILYLFYIFGFFTSRSNFKNHTALKTLYFLLLYYWSLVVGWFWFNKNKQNNCSTHMCFYQRNDWKIQCWENNALHFFFAPMWYGQMGCFFTFPWFDCFVSTTQGSYGTPLGGTGYSKSRNKSKFFYEKIRLSTAHYHQTINQQIGTLQQYDDRCLMAARQNLLTNYGCFVNNCIAP